MAIEGPLRELGIHDVFQLLDLSRKTGRLRVTSTHRDNEGVVYFHNGRIVAAQVRSNPYPLGQLLVRAGRISADQLEQARSLQAAPGETRRLGELLVATNALSLRALERYVHQQIEAVVFELLSWQEGFFSFSETGIDDLPAEIVRGVSTEALLMEGARRIDEWTRIADLVPDVRYVPSLASLDGERLPRLELLPGEWEVLIAVDGTADVRGVAAVLGRSEFDVARIIYGLVSTGVLDVTPPRTSADGSSPGDDDPVLLLAEAREALRDGRTARALELAERAAARGPHADALVEEARALLALDRPGEAQHKLNQALTLDPASVDALMLSAGLAFRVGAHDRALGQWQRVVEMAPDGPDAARASEAMAHVRRLTSLLEPSHA